MTQQHQTWQQWRQTARESVQRSCRRCGRTLLLLQKRSTQLLRRLQLPSRASLLSATLSAQQRQRQQQMKKKQRWWRRESRGEGGVPAAVLGCVWDRAGCESTAELPVKAMIACGGAVFLECSFWSQLQCVCIWLMRWWQFAAWAAVLYKCTHFFLVGQGGGVQHHLVRCARLVPQCSASASYLCSCILPGCCYYAFLL